MVEAQKVLLKQDFSPSLQSREDGLGWMTTISCLPIFNGSTDSKKKKDDEEET